MKKTELIRRIINILISISVVAAGICFIAACISIYNSAETEPYSPETVTTAFDKIALPVYISLALILIGFIYSIIFPVEGEKPKGLIKDYKAVLARLRNRKNFDSLDDESKTLINAEQNKRKILRSILAGVITAGTVIFLINAVNPNNFAPVLGDVTGSVTDVVVKMLLIFTVVSAFGIYYIIAVKKSIIKETELIKKADNATNTNGEQKKFDFVKYIRITILAVAVTFIIIGLFTGGTKDVLAKAANICKECVGIG